MYTLPPVTLNGSPPRPTLTVVSPIRLSGPHVPALACGSPHSFDAREQSPAGPAACAAGCPAAFCWPSSRLIVIVNGAERARLDVRRTRRQATARTATGSTHGAAVRARVVIWKSEEELDRFALPDHGAIDAVVV